MYCDRVWLNKHDSSNTGSVVAFHGESSWKDEDGEFPLDSMLEISDCHGKIRLHKTEKDTDQDFIDKLELLSKTINNFIYYLKDNEAIRKYIIYQPENL